MQKAEGKIEHKNVTGVSFSIINSQLPIRKDPFTTGREEWRIDNAECRIEHKDVTGVSFPILT